MRGAVLLLATLVLTGCAGLFGRQRLSPQLHWMRVRDSLVVALDSGRYDAANRMLATFSAANAGSPYAADAMYWRAMLHLDPRNGGASPVTALALLDTAAMQPAFIERHAEIALARRLARQVHELATRNEQLTQEIARAREIAAGAQQRAQGERAPEPQRNLGDEVQRLREELSKAVADRDRANAELARVRRRLARP